MPYTLEFCIFLIVFFIYVTLWARITTILNRGQLGGNRHIRQLSYRIMGRLSLDYAATYSILMSLIYFLGGVIAIIAVFLVYKENIFVYFSMKPEYAGLLVTGALAEISLNSIANGFATNVSRKMGVNIVDEILKIKWIVGISSLPKMGMPLAAALGGFFEEVVFRGVFLIIVLHHYHVDASVAIILSVLLFLYDQIIQLDTLAQVGVIGPSSLIISIIGALMVVQTGSILPAVFAHVAFLVFYISNPWLASNPYRVQ